MALIDRIPIVSNPELTDRVIGDIQRELAGKLGWLNYAFGRAQRLVKMYGGKRVYSPNVYAGGNEYFPVSPDSKIGNFSFIQIDDPQTIGQSDVRADIKAGFSIIFWCDMRTIPGAENRNTEAVKAEILAALNGVFLKAGRMSISRIYEQAENIYKGYTLDEVDNQFLMHPFCGFRFEGLLYINGSC